MPPPTHITVKAPPERLTPIHPEDGVGPGGGLLYVGDSPLGRRVARVRLSSDTRRALARGDLILCNAAGSAVQSIEAAAAPHDLDTDPNPNPSPKKKEA